MDGQTEEVLLRQRSRGYRLSIPIHTCRYHKAYHDKAEFLKLVADMEYNMCQIMYTTFPCRHEPKCPELTQEQLDELSARVKRLIKRRRKERLRNSPPPKPITELPLIKRSLPTLLADKIVGEMTEMMSKVQPIDVELPWRFPKPEDDEHSDN